MYTAPKIISFRCHKTPAPLKRKARRIWRRRPRGIAFRCHKTPAPIEAR